MASTMVTGWFSAKARTGPGMEFAGTNAELMNGRRMSGYANALSAVHRLRGQTGK